MHRSHTVSAELSSMSPGSPSATERKAYGPTVGFPPGYPLPPPHPPTPGPELRGPPGRRGRLRFGTPVQCSSPVHSGELSIIVTAPWQRCCCPCPALFLFFDSLSCRVAQGAAVKKGLYKFCGVR